MSTTPTPSLGPDTAPNPLVRPRRKRHPLRWLLLFVLAIVGLFIIGGALASHPAPTQAPAITVPAVAPVAPAAPAAPAPTPQVSNGPLTTAGDGEYEVGTAPLQLKPGKWATTGPGGGLTPYAAVKGADDTPVRVINVDGPYTITLKAGQKFETHGGTAWTWKAAK